jgi:diacylglycerol kinase family enzyme
MRITLLHNPEAGGDSSPTRSELEALIRKAGHDVHCRSLKRKGWTSVLKRRADIIAVAGGDGSVGAVARALVGRRVPLAVLPTGTANNVAHMLGLADQTLRRIIRSWDTSRRVGLRVGIARGPWGSRHFIEGAGLGLFSQLLADEKRHGEPSRTGKARARLRHTVRMLRRKLESFPAVRVEATLDGRDISGSYLLLEAMLAPCIGPNLPLAPSAGIGDGQLDVVLVAEEQRGQLLRQLDAWLAGKARPFRLPTKRGKRLRIKCSGAPVHIDDEPESGAPRRGRRASRTIALTVGRKTLQLLVGDEQ